LHDAAEEIPQLTGDECEAPFEDAESLTHPIDQIPGKEHTVLTEESQLTNSDGESNA
jgi:hypothetical protein